MIARILRVVTLPPFVTGSTILILFFSGKIITFKELFMLIGCLVVFPLLAYPFREIFQINTDRRQGQRSVAMVFSALSYSYGLIWSITTEVSLVTSVLFSSYFLSVIGLLIANKLLKFHASGHACSTTAPLILMSWQMGWPYIIWGFILVVIVYYASLYLKQHTFSQLLSGSTISVLAGIISITIFNNFSTF
ncbi:MAG: hypothetical protein VB009_07280 [Erysipelotrichaceae bacterium]|nr:hypothetical protein [Erysipelotrichaceae bacterium]